MARHGSNQEVLRGRANDGRAIWTGWRRVARYCVIGLAVLVTLPTLAAASAPRSPTFSVAISQLLVEGGTSRVTAIFTAVPTTRTQSYSICVRGTDGTSYDFPHELEQTITSSGTTFRSSRSLPAGTYRSYGCVRYADRWLTVGAGATFTVGTPATSPSPTATPTASASATAVPTTAPPTAPPAAPTPAPTAAQNSGQQPETASGDSGATMPVGNLPGWQQVFTEDFKTPAALGSFPGSGYDSRWFCYSGYGDTSNHGVYSPDKVLSVNGGILDWFVHTEGGAHRVAAAVARVPSTGWGQTYGRYSFRFRADTLPGYKLVPILWPDSDNWGEGEVDFPEVSQLVSNERMYANLYQRGDTSTGKPGPGTRFTSGLPANDSGWHTATIEWSPGSITYYLDGARLGTHSTGVPNTSFHLVFQVETILNGAAPADSVAGHVQLDWVTMYSRAS